MSVRAVVAPSGGGVPVGVIVPPGGTPGTIPVWSTGTTLGDSIIKQSSGATSVGVGVTPLASLAGYKSIEVGGPGSGIFSSGLDTYLTANAAYYSAGWKYAAAGPANTIQLNNGATVFNRAASGGAGGAITWLESARIDSSGNVGIGTASPTNIASFTSLTVNGTTGSLVDSFAGGTIYGRIRANANQYWILAQGASTPLILGVQNAESMRIDSSGNVILNTANTGATIQAAGSQQGLKLPATPGNGNANTLDAYEDGGATAGGASFVANITLSAAASWGGTQPTITSAKYTRVGNLVFCTVVLNGAAISATYGSTTLTIATLPAPNANTAVPVSGAGTSGVGVHSTGNVVFLPTITATTEHRLTWFYAV